MPTITVTNLNNVVNGDVSSDAALIANDGGDGISLKEAIFAADATPGPTTIQFAPSLAGQAIMIDSSGLPAITQDGVTINGLVGTDGAPAITIEVAAAAPSPILLLDTASDFTLSHVAFAHLGHVFAVMVQLPFPPSGQTTTGTLSNISITDNSFSNAGYDGSSSSYAVSINLPLNTENSLLQNVIVAGNSFTDWKGEADGVGVGTSGVDDTIRNVEIIANTFTNVTYPVEFASGSASAGALIEGGQVVGNTFTDDFQPINLNNSGSSAVIDGTLIANNLLLNSQNVGISLYGGLNSGADDDTISNTTVVNNVISGSEGQGMVVTGGAADASSNTVSGVRIINDTIVGVSGPGVNAAADVQGATGDTVSNVTIANTLFYDNGVDVLGLAASAVLHSLTVEPEFAGLNDNVSGDPLFVDAADNNFHLQAGSPAIGAGEGDIAPIVDFDLLGRFNDADAGSSATAAGPVDIGAFEFAAGPAPITLPAFLEAELVSVLGAGPGTAAYAAEAQPIVEKLLSGALTVDEAYAEIVAATQNPTPALVAAIFEAPSTVQLTAGAIVSIALDFNESVNVAGFPTLTLANGGTATLADSSSAHVLFFEYTVGAGGAALSSLAPTSVNLGGSSIADSSGNGANVSLAGLSLQDTAALLSGGGNQSLSGGETLLAASGGGETISGGQGVNTVVFTGSLEQYGISENAGAVTVTDNVANRDGTDTLNGVQQAEFADYTLVFDLHSGEDLLVYELYQAAYNRVPDNAGFRFWATTADASSMTSLELADAFLAAPEFAQRYGANPTNLQYVTELYTNVLDRTPDQAGLDFWVGQANAGDPRDQLLIAFAISAENVNLIGPHISEGYWTTH